MGRGREPQSAGYDAFAVLWLVAAAIAAGLVVNLLHLVALVISWE